MAAGWWISWLAATLALCTAPTIQAQARDIFVATDGWDGADGSRSHPFQTISRASAATAPGDIVIVLPGIYGDPVVIRSSGTQNARILYRPDTPGTVTIDRANTPPDTDLVQIGASHVEWRGFYVENSTRSGISAWGTYGVTIADNQVIGSTRAGIWVGHTEAGQSAWNVVIDNIVFGNCIENVHRSWRSGWPRAIAIDLSDNSLVQRNVVFQNYGEGIGLLSTWSAQVLDNVVFDNFSVNIYLDNAPNSKVTRNLVFSTDDRRFYRAGHAAHGVTIANEDTMYTLPSSNIAVTNNTLIGVGGVSYSHYGVGGGLQDSTIEPNIVLGYSDADTIEALARQTARRDFHLVRPCGLIATLSGRCVQIGG